MKFTIVFQHLEHGYQDMLSYRSQAHEDCQPSHPLKMRRFSLQAAILAIAVGTGIFGLEGTGAYANQPGDCCASVSWKCIKWAKSHDTTKPPHRHQHHRDKTQHTVAGAADIWQISYLAQTENCRPLGAFWRVFHPITSLLVHLGAEEGGWAYIKTKRRKQKETD